MKKSAFLAAFLTLLFFSCSLTLDGSTRGSGEGSQIPVEQYIDFSKRYDTSINFNLYEPSERYIILPNFKDSTLLSKLNIKKIKIIYGVTDGETYNETVDVTPGTSTISINISLPGGNYNMSLEAIDANGKVVLKAAQKTVTVRANVVLSFALSPYQDKTSSDAKGSVKATLYFPSGSGSYCVKCGIDNNETASKDVTLSSTGTTECVFEIENVNPGSHPFNVVIANDSTFTNPVVISLSVIVYSNMVSDTSFDASGSSLVSKTIEFTSQLMQAVTLNDYALCINGTGGAFTGSSESVAGKLNTKFSTNFKNAVLFDSLKQALAFINDVYPATEEKTVYISGTVKEKNINFNMSGKTINLTGYKLSSSDIAALDATGLYGRVLAVSAGTVKMKDLTLTGGIEQLGAGILISGGTVELTDGAVIKGNTLMEYDNPDPDVVNVGDGVYVGPSGNFVISGSAYVDSDDYVYLVDGKKINVTGEINPARADGKAATVMPEVYATTVTVLNASDVDLSAVSSKFAIMPETSNLKEWEVESADGNLTPKTPMITIAETDVAGSEKYYYTKNDCANAITNATGTIDVVLFSNVTSSDLGKSTSSGTIAYSITNTVADGVNLSVASGSEINLSDSNSMLFYLCSKLLSADLRGFKTENMTNMYYMFYICNNLTSLDVSTFNTAKVTNMAYMFGQVSKLTSLDLSNFDTSSVTSMSNMFVSSTRLETIDLSSFDTSSVTDMNNMFAGCGGLKSLDLSNFNTSSVTDMSGMFSSCYNNEFTSLDLSSFDTSNVTKMNRMFQVCSKLKTIIVSGKFKTNSVSESADMFKQCNLLKGGKGTSWSDSNSNDVSYARIDGGPSSATPGYFTASPSSGPKLSPDAVGDIVFKDGTAMAYSDIASITDAQKEAAIAVIFYKDTGLNNGDDSTTERLLGVGLCKGFKSWCIGGANASSVRIETILCKNETVDDVLS